ncbi:ABC transporter permease (plasmid) [Skermanella sp. TT6]|uniref:ABC transporter permease n=1 Tax=Skermanella cutis TaxID=2775420 RepID=A0ABX7BHP0_9PROT|nr:ABC transporter permease [Skermanella sp. TT6]QQP92808.1 ABC transporter permease [Skermanella sp. TT6]
MAVDVSQAAGRIGRAVFPARPISWRPHGPAIRRVVLPLAFVVIVFAAWEAAVRLSGVSSMIIVPPSAILGVLSQHYAILMQHALPTLTETVLGFSLASLLGIVLGTLIASSERMRQAIYPNMVLFQVIPKVALAPLFIVWLGIGMPSRLAFAVFIAFFPVAVSTAAGLSGTSPAALRLCRSLTASRWQTFVHVRFPYAVPYIFAGLKVGVTMAVIGIVVGEFVTAQAGLGYIIMFASSAAETALAFAAVLLLCAVGVILYGVVAALEMAVMRKLDAPMSAGDVV